ncbi:diacylglycerol/lipid kinase family protein [Sphingobium olei]|uniref:Diacylglycerol/lipid kinase family protein n=1 Tax=Sphingobium olei TaxID=420955 RepID=A0ABW3P105_9SPHN
MRALLVHNDNAGTDPDPREAIEAVLGAAGIDTIYCAHGDEDLAVALQAPVDFIIAAGGDGTVADVVSEIENADRPIAILPLGGSNNIAHALGVDGPWRDLPGRWSIDQWTWLDRCEADGPWGCKRFVEALGSGVLTDAVDEAEEEPASAAEKQANGRAAFRKALARADPFHCAIDADEWSWEGQCLMVEVMNIGYAGSRLALARNALPGDGMLDVVIVTPDQRDSLLHWAVTPDDQPCPIPARPAATVRMTVKDRPFRLDDRSPNENLSGAVDIRIRVPAVRILKPKVLV